MSPFFCTRFLAATTEHQFTRKAAYACHGTACGCCSAGTGRCAGQGCSTVDAAAVRGTPHATRKGADLRVSFGHRWRVRRTVDGTTVGGTPLAAGQRADLGVSFARDALQVGATLPSAARPQQFLGAAATSRGRCAVADDLVAISTAPTAVGERADLGVIFNGDTAPAWCIRRTVDDTSISCAPFARCKCGDLRVCFNGNGGIGGAVNNRTIRQTPFTCIQRADLGVVFCGDAAVSIVNAFP